jgi:soluble P-type ATPase
LDGALTVFVAVDGSPAGVLIMDDPVRPDARRTIRALRAGGIRRIVVVTGDRSEVAATVGAVIGVDEVLAERSPADKLDAVRSERRRAPTAMVGDGINDAPALGSAEPAAAMDQVRRVHQLLLSEVSPHEEAEERELYPALDRLLGGTDATATMSRAHAEIAHQIRRLGQLLDDIGAGPPDEVDLADLRALLYGLHAILRLHTAQEDESYLSLGDIPVLTGSPEAERKVTRAGPGVRPAA